VVLKQNAIERLGCSHEFVTVSGEDDALDERIYSRILDPDQITRAGRIGAAEPQ
jgi:hypothetical protein